MTRYIVSRLVQFPLILAVIYLGTFFLVWVAPGDPFQQSERAMGSHQMAETRRRLHAETWHGFLSHYTQRVFLHGDFGPSIIKPAKTVNETIATALPRSMTLGLVAMLLATAAGITIGVVSAVRKGGVMDWLGLGLSLIGISIPSFVVAALLISVFAIVLKWFPVGGLDWPAGLWSALAEGRFADAAGIFWGFARMLVLPSVSLSLLPMAYIARLTRASMLDVLGSDYVRTARAKGLSRRVVIWRHCLRNAFLPILSFLGPATAATLTGSFVVESLMNINGMGDMFVNAAKNRDATMLLGAVVIYSVILLSLNLIVDLLYVVVDPRIDLSRRPA